MKTLIAAAMLLALTVPTHASEFRNSDRKWIKTADKYGELYGSVFTERRTCRKITMAYRRHQFAKLCVNREKSWKPTVIASLAAR